MAQAARQQRGELAGVQMSWLARVFTGQQIEPSLLNPYRRMEAEKPMSPEQLDRESALAWKMLDRFFMGV